MKIILLSILICLSSSISYALPASNTIAAETQCKYTLKDAREGLKPFLLVEFIPQKTSLDNNKVLGFATYHDPKDKQNQKSIAAIAVILLDKTKPGYEFVIMVAYRNGNMIMKFEREMIGEKITDCFNFSVETRKAN